MTHSILQLRAPATATGPGRLADSPAPGATAARRRVRGPHVALAVLLALTALAYIWNLGASGDANSFYAAAVQAGTKSWKAFFFGSIDSSSFITVDKPPASLWVMELSGRIFGFSSWSMLIPQALEGVAAVALLAAAVRRSVGEWAGIGAGALLALTPVTALMFRFNNPDALLVLCLVAGAYCLTRALERGGTRWILGAGALVGFAFLAKMMQAFLVLPAFALVYMVAAPVSLRRRTWQTLAAGGALLVSCGWWVATVALWPVADRPFIDGSSSNSIFNLILGYNGLGRIFGGDSNGGGGGHTGIGANFSGSPSLTRLFNDLMGGQASWLIPAALVALVLGLIARRRAPRTDRARAALVLWGGWLLVTGLVFSESSGIIHTYYTVALTPAIAALVAIGGALAWRERRSRIAQAGVGLAIALTAAWSCVLLERTPSWNGWLMPLVIATAVLALGALGLLAAPGTSRLGARATRGLASAGALLAVTASLAGPAAYTAQTISTAHTGSTPTAGPSSGHSGFGGGAGGRGGFASFRGGSTSGTRGGPPSGAGSHGAARTGAPSGARTGTRPSGSGAPSGGGGGGTTSVSSALRKALTADQARYRWVAATSGSQSAASYELATGGAPVMAIGGFSGQGGNLTLAQFKAYVAAGEIHYYIGSGGTGGMGHGGSSSAISSWVQSHFTKVTIGGQTLYDLTQARS